MSDLLKFLPSDWVPVKRDLYYQLTKTKREEVEPIPPEEVLVEKNTMISADKPAKKKLDVILAEIRRRNPTKIYRMGKNSVYLVTGKATRQICPHYVVKFWCRICKPLCRHYESKTECSICYDPDAYDETEFFKDFVYGKDNNQDKLNIMLKKSIRSKPDEKHKILNNILYCSMGHSWKQLCMHYVRRDSCPKCKILCSHFEKKDICPKCNITHDEEFFKDFHYGKDDNQEKLNAMLIEAQRRYSDRVYRIGDKYILREVTKQWQQICKHYVSKQSCDECKQLCIHADLRIECLLCIQHKQDMDFLANDADFQYGRKKDIEKLQNMLLIAQRYHPYQEYRIREKYVVVKHNADDWAQICIHLMPKSQCGKCKRLCLHYNNKQFCELCLSTQSRLEKLQNLCPDSIFKITLYGNVDIQTSNGEWGKACDHGKVKRYCIPCVGEAVCPCGKRLKCQDGVCTKCHPDYIPCVVGTSRIACTFIDELENELKVKIQHKHYDKATKQVIGEEHVVPTWTAKRIDGFAQSSNGTQIAIEFLGDIFHGHPRLWYEIDDYEATNHFGQKHMDRFYDTQEKMRKLVAHGYKVIYMWENSYRQRKAFTSLKSMCGIFKDDLLY